MATGDSRDATVSERFVDYLTLRSLPARNVEVRSEANAGLSMALVSHAPNSGRWFDPVKDLVIGVTLRGSGSQIIRDTGKGRIGFACRSGGILVTPPGTPTYWRFEGSPDVLYFAVPTSALCDLLGDEDCERLTAGLGQYPAFDTLIADLTRRLWYLAGNGAGKLSQPLVHCGIGTILALLQQVASSLPTDEQRKVSPLNFRQVLRVQALMDRPGVRVSVDDLAQEVKLSSDNFGRAFKAATGHSPYRMVSETRIGEAKRLLTETDQSITQIAFELAFSSSAHFSSRFRELAGMSPSRWRKTYKP
jgi:AraC family transcriptional regulator